MDAWPASMHCHEARWVRRLAKHFCRVRIAHRFVELRARCAPYVCFVIANEKLAIAP